MRTQEERFALLKKWKDETNLTLADIARTTGVPLSTTQKIIEGTTKDPAFASVAPIVIALGHTLDEYYGITKDDSKEVTIYSLMQASYEAQLREKDIINEWSLKEKDAIIASKENIIKYFKKILTILGVAVGICLVLCAVISFVALYHL